MAKGKSDKPEFSLGEPATGNPIAPDGNGGDAGKPGADGGSSQKFVEPEPIGTGESGSNAGTDIPKRGRGRPKGSGGTTAKAPNSPDIGAIEATLLSIHIVLAAKVPEMAIEPTEARMIAEAVARVSKHYPQVAAVMTGRIADHIALFTAVSAVYGTRLLAIQQRLKTPKQPPINPNVVTLNQSGPFTPRTG